MNRRYIILLVALALTSCGGEPAPPTVAPFIGGVNGLAVRVMDGAPPPVVTDYGTFPFSIGLVLENAGEADVGPKSENPFVLVRLAGVDSKDFGLEPEETVMRLNEPLRGAKKNFDGTIIPGEVTAFMFEGLSFQPKIAGSELFTIVAEVCYDYSTHATIQVCVKDDIRENIQDSTLCNLRSQLAPMNSGSKLHVVEARQGPSGPNKIQVNMVLQNLGGGVFFNRLDNSDFGACAFDVSNPNIYKALVVVHPVDPVNYQLDCRGLDRDQEGFEGVNIPSGADYGVLRFHHNAPRSLSCFLEKTTDIGGRVFQDILNVEIYYRYGDLIDIPVLVQDYNIG